MTPVRAHLLGWLVFPVLAVANGWVRDVTYGRGMAVDHAHSISVLPLIVLILGWSIVLGRVWALERQADTLKVGAAWLLLTLAFEFGLGAMTGRTLRSMLAEYDLTAGRLWTFVPLVTALAPLLVRRWAARG